MIELWMNLETTPKDQSSWKGNHHHSFLSTTASSISSLTIQGEDEEHSVNFSEGWQDRSEEVFLGEEELWTLG